MTLYCNAFGHDKCMDSFLGATAADGELVCALYNVYAAKCGEKT